MATKAQCAYCFETISARLEGHRKQLSLAQIEDLWEIYEDGDEDEVTAQLKTERAGAENDDDSDAGPGATPQTQTSPYKPAAISRLLNPSPASGSLASSASQSAASSTPSLNSSTSGSSKSSIFSLPDKLKRGHKPKARVADETDGEEYPLFVTWNKVHNGDKRLAGCIGTFEPHEVEEGLNIYSRTA
jgi:hypothetical protein